MTSPYRRSVLMLAGAVSLGLGSAACGGSPEAPEGVAEQYATLAEEIDEAGGETTSGDWRIGYIVEAAEPWFDPQRGGGYTFRAPKDGETHHIEIIPFEEATGRFVPDAPVRLEILDGDGDVVDAKDLIPLYGEFFHYAHNFSIPEDGRYTLRATVGAPTFSRHGEQGETPKLAEGTVVEFTDVELSTQG